MLALTCFKLNSGLSLVIWVTDEIKMRFRYFNFCRIQQQNIMDLVIFFETRQMLERIRPLSPRGDAIINHVSRGQILNIKRAEARVSQKTRAGEMPPVMSTGWKSSKILDSLQNLCIGAELLYILRALALTLRIILHKMTVMNNDAVRPLCILY